MIGSGIGGLTAAALLAHEGRSVLVVERAEGPGGCVHSFRRGAYRLDPAVHLVVDPAHWHRLLEHLDVDETVTMLPVPQFYSAIGPGFELGVPFGGDAFVDAHIDRFGEPARPFLEACVAVHREMHELPGRLDLMNLEARLRNNPELLGLLKATLGEAMDELGLAGEARTALGLPGLYLGLPPSRLSFRTYSQMLLSHAVHGAVLVDGGAQSLVDAFVTSIERDGGELLLGHTVTAILADDGRATGIRLDDGRELSGAAVVSNADPFQTFERLLGLERLPQRYVKRLRRLPISDSIFTLFVATDMDLASSPHASPLMFVTLDADLERSFQLGLDGRPPYATLCIPTLEERDAAPEGQHLIMVTAVSKYEPDRPWSELREGFADSLLGVVKHTFPGIGDGLLHTETATPVAIERHTGNYHGAIYAWGNSPDGIGSRPPTNDTPIAGLFLAGSWTAPGSGFVRALISGHRTAQLVLDAAGAGVELPVFMS